MSGLTPVSANTNLNNFNPNTNFQNAGQYQISSDVRLSSFPNLQNSPSIPSIAGANTSIVGQGQDLAAQDAALAGAQSFKPTGPQVTQTRTPNNFGNNDPGNVTSVVPLGGGRNATIINNGRPADSPAQIGAGSLGNSTIRVGQTIDLGNGNSITAAAIGATNGGGIVGARIQGAGSSGTGFVLQANNLNGNTAVNGGNIVGAARVSQNFPQGTGTLGVTAGADFTNRTSNLILGAEYKPNADATFGLGVNIPMQGGNSIFGGTVRWNF
jgi:hypothetical protein